MRGRVVREKTAVAFFHEQLLQAMSHQKVSTSAFTEFYLVNLLAAFVSGKRLPGREPGFDETPLALLYARALEVARGVLARLPRDEVLMRGRVHAWAADAARRAGRAERARRHFDAALQRWPTPLRTLGVRLPVRIQAGDHPRAREVARLLDASPRLTPGEIGFVVDVRALQRGRGLRLCLSGPRGRRYACAVADLSKASDEAEKLALAVDAFHDEVFAPKIDLTQQDINSLDGSAVRGSADRLLRQVLGE